MRILRTVLIVLSLGLFANLPAHGQDYIAMVEQMAQDAGRRAEMYARNAIQIYRQETGDWSTPDQQVWAYLDALARQQNPGFYADLQRREQRFQQQQQAYVANSNAILDQMYNSYMDRSARQYAGHQRYIREGIWERSLFTNGNGNLYSLPYYSPGTIYQSNDGSMFIQDNAGQYHGYDGNGWRTNLYDYDN